MKHGGAKTKASIKDKDRGFAEMLKRIDRATVFGAKLEVGIIGEQADAAHIDDEGNDSGLTIAELGEIHEYGLGVPRRSFIADWADETEEEHREQIRKMAYAVVQGKVASWEIGLERLGLRYQAEVQKRISDGISPALAESTIQRKGSSIPLIDTGVLRSSITYKVTR